MIHTVGTLQVKIQYSIYIEKAPMCRCVPMRVIYGPCLGGELTKERNVHKSQGLFPEPRCRTSVRQDPTPSDFHFPRPRIAGSWNKHTCRQRAVGSTLSLAAKDVSRLPQPRDMSLPHPRSPGRMLLTGHCPRFLSSHVT